jgi:LPS-assembly protein
MSYKYLPGKAKIAFLLFASILASAKIASALTLPPPSILKNYLKLDAEKISISKDDALLEATGVVHLEYEGKEISAGKLSYYYERGVLELDEGVTFTDEDMDFSFSMVSIDLRKKKSTFYDGYMHIKSENLIVSAERFEELTKDKYKIFKAKLTTCDECDKADWRIKIRRGTLTLGGYATGTGISLDIRDRPFFWFPFAFFPAKTNRESGFLVPMFQSSRTKGTRVILPFYIVTSGFSDVTMNLDYMSKRGVKPEGEFRYRLTQYSKGKLTGAYINDREFDDERFRVEYSTSVTGDFPFFATANVDYTSDKDYYLDLEDDIYLRSSRQIISDLSAGYEGRDLYFELYGTYIDDLFPVQSRSETVQVLPAVRSTFRKKRILYDFFARADLEVKNFYTSANGSTQKSNVNIEAELPLKLGEILLLHLYSNLVDGYYYFENQQGGENGENFLYWDNRGTVKTSLYRKFRLKKKELVHRVEPYVTFQKTSRISGFSPVIFEPVDRAPEKTRMIFGFRNVFTSVYEGGEMKSTGSFVVKYSFDLERQVDSSSNLVDPFSEYFRTYQDQIDIAVDGFLSDDPSSDLYFEGNLLPSERLKINTEGFFDTKAGVVDKVSFGLKYDDKDTTFISMMVRHTRTLATDLNLNYDDRIFRWLRVKGWLNYSLKDEVIIENTSFFEYIPRSECWSLTFGASRKTRPAETSFSLFFSLRGLGAIGQ